MLSYQHAYHAGNPADVHKHGALAELISLLTVKQRGISYLETHAGRGLYDLGSDEALKTGEAGEGIARLNPDPQTPYGAAIGAVRARHGEQAYPGSPWIAAALLRPQDRLVLMERHPQEHAALKRAMKGTGAEVHARDGYEGALALAPMEPRRGLVLIDPSYEVKTEYAAAGDLALRLHRRWPQAAVLVWYPLLDAGRHEGLLARLEEARPVVDEVLFGPGEGRGMKGSGLALLAPPFGAVEAMAAAVRRAAPVLRRR